MKNIVFTCVLLCLFSHSTIAQGDDSSQSSCRRLDNSKPWIYLGFEKIDRPVSGSKTNSETIVLRLNNNSACDLTFLADTPTTIQVVKAPNTKPRIEYQRVKASEGDDNKYELFTQKVELPKSVQ